jgi:hypothetical protein
VSRRAGPPSRRSFPWNDVDPERRNAVLLIGGIAIVVILALGLIAYGYYNDRIAPKHEAVLALAGDDIDYSDLERRARAEDRDSKLDLTKETSIPELLSVMEREAVLREAARREGIVITDGEVMGQIATKLGMPSDSARNTIAPALRARLLRLGLSLDEYEDIVRAELAETKLKLKVEQSVPNEAEQVFLRVIETATQSGALQARQSIIQEGVSFAVAAAAASQHPTKEQGGDLGFVPRGALPPEVEKVAFSSTGLSEVIETKTSFWLIEVVGKEFQAVGDTARRLYVENTLAAKITDTRNALQSEPRLRSGQVQRILRSIATGA